METSDPATTETTQEKGKIWLRDRHWNLKTYTRTVRKIRHITPTHRVGQVSMRSHGSFSVEEVGHLSGYWRMR
jgi:hypothetical protein